MTGSPVPSLSLLTQPPLQNELQSSTKYRPSGFPGWNADNRAEWSPRLFLWASRAHLINGRWSWQQDCGNLRPKAEEDRPTTASPEANGQDLRASPLSCHSVLPDRGSWPSHPGRREDGEQKGVMPDSRAGRRASQPAPARVPTVSRAKGAQGQAGSVVAAPAPPWGRGLTAPVSCTRSTGPAVIRCEFKTNDILVM